MDAAGKVCADPANGADLGPGGACCTAMEGVGPDCLAQGSAGGGAERHLGCSPSESLLFFVDSLCYTPPGPLLLPPLLLPLACFFCKQHLPLQMNR